MTDTPLTYYELQDKNFISKEFSQELERRYWRLVKSLEIERTLSKQYSDGMEDFRQKYLNIKNGKQ